MDPLCGTCSRAIASPAKPTSPCSGPCGRRFHPDCLAGSLNSLTKDVLTSGAAEARGLQWFCPECRPGGEVWPLVFKLLHGTSLMRVREVCRRWRELVDRSAELTDRLPVQFPERTWLDEDYRAQNLPSAARRAVMTFCVVNGIGGWWPGFAGRLVNLQLVGCQVRHPVLMEMLRHMPNLFVLHMFSEVEVRPEDDLTGGGVTCPSLKQLVVYHLPWEGLITICPRLETLIQDGPMWKQGVFNAVVKATQDTLKALECDFNSELMDVITRLDRLRLKAVVPFSKWGSNEEETTILSLTRAQPSIEELLNKHVKLSTLALCEVGRNLPKLAKLSISVQGDTEITIPSFLDFMPSLKDLTLYYSFKCGEVNFNGHSGHNLEKLNLQFGTSASKNPTHLNLKQFLNSCSTLLRLKLTVCTLNDWSDVLDFALNPRSPLHQLTLNAIHTLTEAQLSPNLPPSNLQFLQISESQLTTEDLITLLTACSRLTEARLLKLTTLTDAVIGALSPYLERLHLTECPHVTDAAAVYLATRTHRRQLKELTIVDCELVTHRTELVLESYQGLQVRVHQNPELPFWMPHPLPYPL